MKLFDNLRDDVFGGITSSVVALPLAIAFGVAAFAPLGPEYVAQGALAGLYSTIVAGALASVFGGTPSQMTGPTPSTAVVVAAVISNLLQDPRIHAVGLGPTQVILLVVAVTIAIGGFVQILLGLVGGGKLIKYIPYPVVAGFMNGIAVIIFLAQLQPFFGATDSTSLAAVMGSIRYEALVAGTVTIAVTIAAPRIIRVVPAALVGLLGGAGAYFLLGLTASPDLLQLTGNALIIGPIPRAVPTPYQAVALFRAVGDIPPSTWVVILIPALTLSILASIDTLLTSVVADVATRTRHDSNRELIGQGIGNVASAMFGGLPAAGSTAVTMVNINSGGRTATSGVIKSVVVVVVVLALSSIVQWVPMAVLAGILLVTATKMVDYESINLFKKKAAFENLLIILAVTIITVSIDLVIAVGIGLIIASFLFVKEQIRRTIVRRKYTGNLVHSKKVRDQVSMRVLEEKGHVITVYELSGSLFFGTCDKLQTEIEKDLASLCIILDLKRVDTIDLTGAQLIRQIVDRVSDQGHYLVLASLDVPGDPDKERVRKFMQDLGVLDVVGAEHIFPDTDHALEWAEEILIKRETAETPVDKDALALQQIMVFKNLSADQLQLVHPYMQRKAFTEGEIIFREGDPGDGIYFILSGFVTVLADLNGKDTARRLATFAEGVFFGDMALLENQPRSATVRAETDTTLFFMANEDFGRLTKLQPDVATRVLLGIARELSYRLRVTTAEVRALAE